MESRPTTEEQVKQEWPIHFSVPDAEVWDSLVGSLTGTSEPQDVCDILESVMVTRGGCDGE